MVGDQKSREKWNRMSLRNRLVAFERDQIRNALARHAGNVMRTARFLQVPLATLRYRMDRLDIDPNAYRPNGQNGKTR